MVFWEKWRFKISGIIIALLSLLAIAAAGSDFKILPNRFLLTLMHTGYLSLSPSAVSDGKMPYFIRKRSPIFPGDYFIHPWLADSTSVSNLEKTEVDSLLNLFILPNFYDKTILDNLIDYDYLIAKGTINRHEFYVRYAGGDTVYTISGWYGRFISFYRVVPGSFRYNVSQFQEAVEKLSSTYRKTKDNAFKMRDDGENYMLEYIDKENMMRVRNYLISSSNIFGLSVTEEDELKTYNLIEITKFIDPEVIP